MQLDFFIVDICIPGFQVHKFIQTQKNNFKTVALPEFTYMASEMSTSVTTKIKTQVVKGNRAYFANKTLLNSKINT